MANDLVGTQEEDSQAKANAHAQIPQEKLPQPLSDQSITELQRDLGETVNNFNTFKDGIEKTVKGIVDEAVKTKDIVSKTHDLVIFGFFVLLFTLAVAIITVWLNYHDSYDKFNESVNQLQNNQYQFQQKEIEFLLKTATPSGF